MAHNDLPLNLPHAGRVAGRILDLLERHCEEHGIDAPDVFRAAELLEALLSFYVHDGENPEESEAQKVTETAADLGRRLVAALEAANIRGDRLGQYVRNLFECLELGEEGAAISLRAGENPDSLQRP
jgi:hypothetical protein